MSRPAGIIFLLFLLLGLPSLVSGATYPLAVFETYALGESGVARTNEVVSMGFPLSKGVASNLSSLGVNGASSQQFVELARWPDNSLKWVLVDFIAPSLGAGVKDTTTYTLTTTGSGTTSGASICSLNAGVLTATTGTMTAKVRTNNFNVLNEVTLSDGKQLVLPNNLGEVIWEDESGNAVSSRNGNLTRLEIVFNGPLHCHAVAEGWFGGTGEG